MAPNGDFNEETMVEEGGEEYLLSRNKVKSNRRDFSMEPKGKGITVSGSKSGCPVGCQERIDR